MSAFYKKKAAGKVSQFRRYTSFNTHDTHVLEGKTKRIVVMNGVEKRCNLILQFFKEMYTFSLNEGEELDEPWGETLRLFDIVDYLKEKSRQAYTYQDVVSAIRKLEACNLIVKFSRGLYRLTFNPLHMNVSFI